jgi:hypothetical protein
MRYAGLHLLCHSDDPGRGAASCPCCEGTDAVAGVSCSDVLLQRQDAKAAVLWAAEEHGSRQDGESPWPEPLLAALPGRKRQWQRRRRVLRLRWLRLLLLLPPCCCCLLPLLGMLLLHDWVLTAICQGGGQ